MAKTGTGYLGGDDNMKRVKQYYLYAVAVLIAVFLGSLASFAHRRRLEIPSQSDDGRG
jgi:hypothetical protein